MARISVEEALPRTGGGKVYYKTVLADLLTPVSAYLRVSRGADRAFLLESVEGGEKIGRYSFIGVDPQKSFEGSFEDFRDSFPPPRPVPQGLPPFCGGAVGYFDYDLVREFESLPSRAASGPTVHMDFYSCVLAFDHLKHQIVIVSHKSADEVARLEHRLLSSPLSGDLTLPAIRESSGGSLSLRSNMTAAEFERAVRRAKQYIERGDIFQVVLSQRFETSYGQDPFDVYRALRFVNPSPYLFFLKMGDLSIAGSSPEMLVRVQDGDLSYRPIAGTRRRGRTQEEEAALEAELLKDEKERAEHLMLVDLGRNDLGRVSEFGSIEVDRFMFVEKYSHVMHLVSSLRGKLKSSMDRFDALAACFPAGTVTGAPKVRAMEIIDETEPDPRGIYAGAVGYLDFSGNLDTCIAIRTIVFREGKAFLQAGAGIVADSIPDREYEECWNKARALLQALEYSQTLNRGSRS